MRKNNGVLRDPVCGKKINKNKAHAKVFYNKNEYYVCCPMCQAAFEDEPEKYANNYKR